MKVAITLTDQLVAETTIDLASRNAGKDIAAAFRKNIGSDVVATYEESTRRLEIEATEEAIARALFQLAAPGWAGDREG